MFFNAGRMGFRHFKIEVPPPVPGVSEGGTGCFGLTGTDRIVFAFDSYSVPDKPSFSYIYSCSDAADCFQYGIDKPFPDTTDCLNSQYEGSVGQPGGTFSVDPFNYCSCTGGRALALACWKDKLDISASCVPDIPGLELCPNGDLDFDSPDFADICENFPIGADGGFDNPNNEELCTFCNSEAGGVSGDSVQCGIKKVWSGYCNCTNRTEVDGDICAENCDSNVGSLPGCQHCRESLGLAWFLQSNDQNEQCEVGDSTDYLLPELVSGYTGWGPPDGRNHDYKANAEIQSFFSGHVCGTPNLPDGAQLSIPVSELTPNGSITDTSQIKPQNFLNITGHNCAACSSGSVFQTAFSYLTVESGTTFCNIFLSPKISSACASGTGLVPDRPGCTFCYNGITFETGPCIHTTKDRASNGATQLDEVGNVIQSPERRCSTPYLSNMGCANGLARHYSLEEISNNVGQGSAKVLNSEMRKYRRIDNSEVDTCGVNPCMTSSYFLEDGGETPTGGFNGTNCWGYLGEKNGYPIKVSNSAIGDPNNPIWKRSSFYEYYFSLCDEQPAAFSFGGFEKGRTSDLVVGVQSERMERANECINRVGRRSEQLFDLPLVSVGTARSFFAPWVDDMIHQIATPSVSGRKLGGGGEVAANGFFGDRYSVDDPGRPVINHLAMGPYPAYSYYSWFYGPMFDVSETMTQFDSSDAQFGSDYFGANHAAINTRFEGQWGPNIFGKFLTHPGFVGTPDDTMRNLSAAARGYFDSWGAIKLNNFWRNSGSVFTGGTLSKFTDTLYTGVEAFNNPNQNRKNVSVEFLADDSLWPPADMSNGYFIPVAGATASAGPLDHNPHGITAHSSLGWCSSVNRQNASWLNPRFTVASNWLWPGDRQEYSVSDHKMMFATATVDTGELTPESFTSAGGRNLNVNTDNFNRGDEDNAQFFIDYRGRSRDMPFGQIYTYTSETREDLPTIGSFLESKTELGYGSDDETRVSPFAPLNRSYNVTYLSVPADSGGGPGFLGGSSSFRNTNSSSAFLECDYPPGSPFGGQGACRCVSDVGGIEVNVPSIDFNCNLSCPNGENINSVTCICDLCACWSANEGSDCLDYVQNPLTGDPLTKDQMAALCKCCGGFGSPNPIDGDNDCTDTCAPCVDLHGCTHCQQGGPTPECEDSCGGPTQFNTETNDLHESFQFPTTYNAYWNQPVWKPNPTGVFQKYIVNGNSQSVETITATPAMELHMSINRYDNPANQKGGNAFRRFGGFTNVKQTASPNQRFEGMDRYRLHLVLPSNPSNTGGGIDPERTVMPSPSLLSYYALPIIGGWGYAGPPSNKTTYDGLLPYRGVGCGKGFLYGSYGRDIIWADPTSFGLEDKLFKNFDGSAVTGPTRADRNQFSSTVSDFHSQRLFSNGGNMTNNTAMVDFTESELEDILDVSENPGRGELTQGGYTAQNFMSTATQCGNTAWQMIRASHCLLDISTGAGKSGILTIPSSYVGCTAYYKSGSSPAANGSDAEAVYQFNGNGWWYRTHEQLRLGINEEGYTSGVGPAGYVRHQNGYFPEYVTGKTETGDRMYGPATTTESSDSLINKLRGTTFDSGHGFVQDVLAQAEVASVGTGDFESISNNSQLNNGWTACAPNAANPTLDSLGYQKQFVEGHFPEIATGYYPSQGELFLDDTKMFDAVFAWETGSTAGVALGGHFTLINQSGIDLTIRVTGGTPSGLSSNSNPINLDIEPFKDSLNNFGETADLMCQTDTDLVRPYLGNCSRTNDHSAGGYKVWPNEYLLNQIVGWVYPNAQG